jgi:hypothetical protein
MPQTATGLLGTQQTPGVLTPAMLSPFTKGSSLRVGLLSYWTLDELSGSNAADAVGGRAGTWQGTLGSQWGTGIIAGGGVFNGTDNSVLLPVSTQLQFAAGAGRTFAGWAFLTANGAFPMVIGSAATSSELRFNGGTRIPQWNQTASQVTAPAAVALSTWHHLVGTSDATGSALYVDGVMAASSATPHGASPVQLAVGARSTFANGLTGRIDEVGLWSRALTAGEVATLYNAGAGKRPF